MGYTNHRIIIVTSWNIDHVTIAHGKAQQLLGNLVTPIIPWEINEGSSFAILPDGSKEGWPESKRYDKLRKEFVLFLDTMAYDDGSSAIKYVYVMLDEDGKYKFEKT